MKKIPFLILAIIGLMTINSCKKDKQEDTVPEDVPNKDVTAEKTNVKTYEIVNLIAHENLANKYSATFGSATIELLKTSDSTLTFYVPEITAGKVSLKFDLATISFNVTKIEVVNPNQLMVDLFKSIDLKINALSTTNAEGLAQIDSLKKYKVETVSLFNTLSDENKKLTVLFYEANKTLFQSTSASIYSSLDAPTVFGRQSGCPRTDFRTFYGCTADNLGTAAVGLKNSSVRFLEMVGMAGAMGLVAANTSVLGPVAWGITAVGMALPIGAAAYILVTEVAPAALHFKNSVSPFLEANWLFGKGLFLTVTSVFQDQTSVPLKLQPTYHSLTSSDAGANTGSGYFISAMATLSPYWNKLTAIFGNFPTYKNTEESTTLASNDVSISNISNSNVQYQGNSGQSVKFKSLSGNEESFSYNIKVSKEGFIEEKTLTGKVLAVTDSTEIYKTSALGNYTVNGHVGNGPKSRLYCELKTGTWNYATYTIYDDTSWPDGKSWTVSWSIQKYNGKYYYKDNWFTGLYDSINDPLSYPVVSFKHHLNTTYTK